MERKTTLLELRGALDSAQAKRSEILESAEGTDRALREAEAAFETANTRHNDKLLWSAHSPAALPGLAESQSALSDARAELERRRKAYVLLIELLEDIERLIDRLEAGVCGTREELERAALCGPELELPIWD
jgi:hypothetical protein